MINKSNNKSNNNLCHRNQGAVLILIFLIFVILSLYYFLKLQDVYSNINSINKPPLVRKKASTIVDVVDKNIIHDNKLEKSKELLQNFNRHIILSNKLIDANPPKKSMSKINSINSDDLTEIEENKLFNILKEIIDNSKEENIPTLVKAFRRGKIDWHDLVRPLPDTNNADYNWERLVQSEIDVTKILTWNTKGYKPNHGPLSAFAMCSFVKDKCMIHTKGDCLRNSFCGWCESSKICIDMLNTAQSNYLRPLCMDNLQFNQNTCSGSYSIFDKDKQIFVSETNTKNCEYIINEPYIQPKPGIN